MARIDGEAVVKGFSPFERSPSQPQEDLPQSE